MKIYYQGFSLYFINLKIQKMGKICYFLIILVASFSSYGQSLKIDGVGKVTLNGKTGEGRFAPHINIFSTDTIFSGANTGLNLYNTDITNGNTLRLNFLTNKNPFGNFEDFANIAVRFTNRAENLKTAELHFFTLNRGTWQNRFSITPANTNPNDVLFSFNANTGGGLF